MSKRPNILWFCTDQQRYDTIAALGNSEIRTPNIDRLCKQGWAFQRAYAQAPICTPSRASMMTGRYPASHHVMRNGSDRFPDSEELVSGILARAGYHCGLVGKLHLSGQAKGERRPIEDGFEMFEWNPHPGYKGPDSGYTEWLKTKQKSHAELYADPVRFCGSGIPADLNQNAWATEIAIDFITNRAEKDWFLMVNLFDPHPPFDPPAEYLSRYNPQDLSYPVFRESDIENQTFLKGVPFQTEVLDVFGPMPERNGAGAEPGRPEQVAAKVPSSFDGRAIKAAYYAMIENIDDCFGRICDTLDRLNLTEDTLVIFSSDHGEMLGDHGLLYKGCRFYDPLVRVPLILRKPGRVSPDVTSNALVELVDIAPTILECAGIEASPRMQGTSFWPLICGEGDPDTHKSAVLSEFNDSQAGFTPEHGVMVFDGTYKSSFYEHHGLMELYNLSLDPMEFDNLVRTGLPAELKAEILERHMRKWLSTSDAGAIRTAAH